MDSAGIAEFEAYQEGYCLDAEEAAIDVVSYTFARPKSAILLFCPFHAGARVTLLTKKQITRVRTPSTNLEDLNHVKELAVDVADDGDGCLHLHDIALFHQQLFRLGAYCLDDRVGEQLLVVQSFYAFVEIDTG